MIWLAAAPLISKTVKVVATFATSLVIVILMGAPLLGWFVQPFAPFWFGQNTTSGLPVIGPTPVVVPSTGGSTTIALPTLTVAPVAITPSSLVGRVIAEAMTWLGVPYLWSGCSRHGVDCSCAVMNWWGSVGVKLQRTTVTQIASLPSVPRDQLQPGDVVFFNNTCTDCGPNPTHEGMVVNAQAGVMIEAGSPVQLASYTTGFYGAKYAGAGRPHA